MSLVFDGKEIKLKRVVYIDPKKDTKRVSLYLPDELPDGFELGKSFSDHRGEEFMSIQVEGKLKIGKSDEVYVSPCMENEPLTEDELEQLVKTLKSIKFERERKYKEKKS